MAETEEKTTTITDGNADKAAPPPRSNKLSKKKTKIDWSSDLHKKFVKAVEQLGIDQAIPSRILELMRVEGLTRHNIASHLQKYRMHRRHILPKDDNTRKWHLNNKLDLASSFHRNHNPLKPVIAYPLYHHPHTIYHHHHNWVGPNGYPMANPSTAPMWGSPAGYYHPPWQQQQQPPYPAAVHADAWGCPVVPTSNGGQYSHFQSGYNIGPRKVVDFLPADEIIDEVVEEAISKPWLPLPIGLKPPSTESVLIELSKQGLSGVVAPPQQQINARRYHS